VTVHQSPLAYLLGVERVALLRAFAGKYDRDFCHARIAEIRRLLDMPSLCDEEVDAHRVDPVESYRAWSATYDGEPRNGLFDIDEPIVRCDEPRMTCGDERARMPDYAAPGPWDLWPWSLLAMVPAAHTAAWNGVPSLIVRHFQRSSSDVTARGPAA
jgi:hypothetical protein